MKWVLRITQPILNNEFNKQIDKHEKTLKANWKQQKNRLYFKFMLLFALKINIFVVLILQKDCKYILTPKNNFLTNK
jgi:hypothetical protein